MANMTFWYGVNGAQGVWYLEDGKATFSPIDVSLLPGPAPDFGWLKDQVTTKVTGETWSDDLFYSDRIRMDTDGETTIVDVTGTWNTVKNMQVKSSAGQNIYVDGIVHVDAQIGYGTTDSTTLFLNGIKRANIITGEGGDTIELRICADANSVWQDDFRIATQGGEDFVRIAPLDVEAELAAGDYTYIESVNKPGIPLITSGEGRNSHIDLGAGNDTFIGYNTNDHVIGNTDDGSVELVYEQASGGYAYSIGGSTKWGCWGGHDSTLYRIDLETGETVAVGEVKISGFKGKWGNNLDVESLSFNPADGFLYGFTVSPGKKVGLIKVDPETAEATYIGGNVASYKSHLQGMTFDKDGTLYMASERDLVTVNTATGDVTVVGNNVLSKKVGALAIDVDTGLIYALSREGWNTVMTVVDKNNGQVVETFKVDGLSKFSQLEGMSFDGAGVLWAEDRITGKLYQIDTETHEAHYVSKTLSVWHQTGDGFESLAIAPKSPELIDVKAVGGDLITTGEGFDHLFYAAGDGVDQVTDFDTEMDVLHISGYAAEDIDIQQWNGDTVIRFKDDSADGYVDNALIELQNVTGFTADMISYTSAADYYGT